LASTLQAGRASSVTEIAASEHLTGSCVTRVLRLAFPAPKIVAAIANGTQPVELTVDRILRTGPLPVAWHEQRRDLGFPPPLGGTTQLPSRDFGQ